MDSRGRITQVFKQVAYAGMVAATDIFDERCINSRTMRGGNSQICSVHVYVQSNELVDNPTGVIIHCIDDFLGDLYLFVKPLITEAYKELEGYLRLLPRLCDDKLSCICDYEKR